MTIRSPQVFFDFTQLSERPWQTSGCDEDFPAPGIFDPPDRRAEPERGIPEAVSAFFTDGPPGQDEPPFAEQAHIASRFRSFAEHSSDAILMADLSAGTIDYLSPAAQRLWSDRPPIATIADWEASIHPDDLDFARDRRELVRQGLHQRFQYRIVGSHGRIARHVRETSFPMPSHDGAGECIGGIVEDISPEIPIYLVKPPGAGHTAVTDGLRSIACRVTTFSSYKELMNVAEVLHPGCVVIDVSKTAPTPEALLRLLSLRPVELQIILVGAQGTQSCDVIDALKAGAADYLIHPFTQDNLANAVDKASQALALSIPPKTDSGDASRKRLTSLPSREREVFLGLVGGGTNKSIARKLQLSPRTVEVHRAHLMQRLNLRNLTELLHFAHEAGIKSSL